MERTETDGAGRLRAWLETTGAPQHDLATRLGTTQSTVAKWAGGIQRPDPHLRRALAGVTGIPETAWETEAERAQVERAVSTARERAEAEVS